MNDAASIKKHRLKAGASYRDTIRLLLQLCKGKRESTDKKAHWFYSLFLDRKSYGQPKTIEEVRQKLQSAWWLEEEDLQQEIYYHTLRLRLTSNNQIFYVLGRVLRDHLLYEQKLFSRLSGWENRIDNNILYWICLPLGPQILFDKNLLYKCKLPLYDKYLVYLLCILKLDTGEIKDIFMQTCPQTNRFLMDFRKIMEESTWLNKKPKPI